MKITVVNGSPKGAGSNTNVLVEAFLSGGRAAGAKTENIFLSDYNIGHCRGCFACWLKTPGKCVLNDDMGKVLERIDLTNTAGDVLVLATPLYYDNISGLLKNFMDRLVVLGDPHFQKSANGESRHLVSDKLCSPKLVLISNCGFPERSHFQVISHWIERAALNMHTDVIGEILVPQGGLLKTPVDALKPIVAEYLNKVSQAGREVVEQGKIAEGTAKALEQKFLPDEVYIEEANKYFDGVLAK